MTTKPDARCAAEVRRSASQTRGTTLLCWLLVLAMAVSAECAWVVWLRDAWTVAPTLLRAHLHDQRSPSEQLAKWPAELKP